MRRENNPISFFTDISLSLSFFLLLNTFVRVSLCIDIFFSRFANFCCGCRSLKLRLFSFLIFRGTVRHHYHPQRCSILLSFATFLPHSTCFFAPHSALCHWCCRCCCCRFFVIGLAFQQNPTSEKGSKNKVDNLSIYTTI